MYEDYTSQYADVTPGQTYNMQINLGSCKKEYFGNRLSSSVQEGFF